MNCKPVIYYVEGECEKKLINCLKNKQLIIAGRAEVFNVLEKKLSVAKLMKVKPGTTFILLFDTDTTNDLSTFKENCLLIKNEVHQAKIYTILQVNNLEDELKRATSISQIKDLTGSKSNSDFKADFINLSDCFSTLLNHNFDLSKMWCQTTTGPFACLKQNTDKIVLKTKSK